MDYQLLVPVLWKRIAGDGFIKKLFSIIKNIAL